MAVPAYGFDRIVIFGDSLSDTGNANLGFNLPPPYFSNRISNGPVAVDILTSYFGLSANTAGQLSSGNGDNFAVSGGNAAGGAPQDLAAQVSAFQSRHPQGVEGNTLIVILIGGNDLRDTKNNININTRRQLVQQSVNAIGNAAETISALGARYILVANGPDISRIPETLSTAVTDPGLISRARDTTILFNTLLTQRVTQLSQQLNSKVSLFDLFQSFNRVLNNFTNFGFTVNNRACFDPQRFRLNPGCNFQRYVFFDSIHPTAKTHEILGNAMIESALSLKSSDGRAITGPLKLLLD